MSKGDAERGILVAGICLWIARHAEQVMEYRVMVLVRRARRVERRLARRTVIERAKP